METSDPSSEEASGSPPYPPLDVVFWGDYACFTRPEAKTERVSYSVPTPSAARGMLEAIFWKPEFRYRIREIHVLQPIQYASLLRNELTDKMPDPRRETPAPQNITERRTQRHTLALRNVAYRILADVVKRPDVTENSAKYRDQFRRRVGRGECFSRPVLGCREFAANFCAPGDLPANAGFDLTPIPASQDLGLMLFEIAFAENMDANAPLFFEAHLEAGRLVVPPDLYEKLTVISGPWRARPRPEDAAEKGDKLL